MSEEDVEALARGRVWTGEQALARGLVDVLGDIQIAAGRARELAGLDPRRHVTLLNMAEPKSYQLPGTAPAELGTWLAGLLSLFRGGTVALAPWTIRLRDR